MSNTTGTTRGTYPSPWSAYNHPYFIVWSVWHNALVSCVLWSIICLFFPFSFGHCIVCMSYDLRRQLTLCIFTSFLSYVWHSQISNRPIVFLDSDEFHYEVIFKYFFYVKHAWLFFHKYVLLYYVWKFVLNAYRFLFCLFPFSCPCVSILYLAMSAGYLVTL